MYDSSSYNPLSKENEILKLNYKIRKGKYNNIMNRKKGEGKTNREKNAFPFSLIILHFPISP